MLCTMHYNREWNDLTSDSDQSRSEHNAPNHITTHLLTTFLFSSDATAQCKLFLTVPNRNILTYLLITTAALVTHNTSKRFTQFGLFMLIDGTIDQQHFLSLYHSTAS